MTKAAAIAIASVFKSAGFVNAEVSPALSKSTGWGVKHAGCIAFTEEAAGERLARLVRDSTARSLGFEVTPGGYVVEK